MKRRRCPLVSSWNALCLVFGRHGSEQTGGGEAEQIQKATNQQKLHYTRWNPVPTGYRRDPFLNPLLIPLGEKSTTEEESRGEPPPGIEGTYLAQAVLVGISAERRSPDCDFPGTRPAGVFPPGRRPDVRRPCKEDSG